VAIKCFGVGCSYLVVIGDLMPEAMHQLAPAATLLHQVCGLTQRRS
jgi:amino acid permease